MIHVAHMLDGARFGGAEEALARLARTLDPGRVRLTTALWADARLAARLRAQGAQPHLLPPPRGWRWSGGALAGFLRERQIAILHTHTSRANLLGRIAAARAGIAHVATIHSPIRLDANDSSTPVSARRVLAAWIDRAGARRSARIVFVSRAERRRAIARGLPESRAVWIPNGVEIGPPPAAERVEALRRRWGLEPGRPRAMMVAQLRPRKGPETLLRALPIIRATLPRAEAVFVGDAEFVESRDYLAELKALAAALGVAPSARFVGFCDDVPAALRLGDALVLPSLFGEGLPLALLEGMAAGLPLIASDAEGNREAVEPESNGLLFAPGDHQALARAAVRLLADPALRAKMGAAGERIARERFDMAAVARRHADLYEEIAASGK